MFDSINWYLKKDSVYYFYSYFSASPSLSALGPLACFVSYFKCWNEILLYIRNEHKTVHEPRHHKTNNVRVRRAKTHLPRLIRVFAVRSMGSYGPKLFHADGEDWSDWADAQADLSLRWAHIPFCWFCHEAAQFTLNWSFVSKSCFGL